ncbi:hypothetical protein F4774DRAFT_419297 [Daldinia eschscholtzii]|nr:hypothetical protein F4774DRAFT_419297 [Daldinia eschscholtzii]
MADNQGHAQPGYPYPPSTRRSVPRRNTDIKQPTPIASYAHGNPNQAHRRFSSVLNAADPVLAPGKPFKITPTLTEEPGILQPGAGFVAQEAARLNVASVNDSVPRLNSPSVASTSLATVAPSEAGSGGSDRSASSATERPFTNRDGTGKAGSRRKRFPNKQPNALNFLDSDSPTVTPESIRRSMEEAASRSPTSVQCQSPSTRSASSVSNNFRDDASEPIGEHDRDRSTSPERGPNTADEGYPPAHNGIRNGGIDNRKRSYDFSESHRTNSEHSHGPPGDFAPREPSRGRPQHVSRPERLPLTGYELLASKISTSSSDHGGNLRPIYRRFETLNHRLLLYLQDELCELEEQLHRLDAADTQARRLPNCIFPASRRAEFMASGELHWHKTDILGKIGFKLDQYNRVLSSFKDTQGMPAPTMEDIHEYRNYLATHAPIAEAETRFLDATDDLVCPSYEYQEVVDEDPIPTPIPQHDFPIHEPRSVSPVPSPIKSRPTSPYRQEEVGTETVISMYEESPIVPLSIGITVSVILPILTFLIIPGYLGRLTVVFLVGLGILGALIQGGIVAIRTWELSVCVGLYGAVMAVIAGIV